MAKSMKIPETEDEIDDYCGKLKETVSCVSSYRQCLKAFPKQLFNIVVRDIKKQMKLICSSSAKKKEALGHLKCFEEKHREFLIGVLNGVTNVLFNIR